MNSSTIDFNSNFNFACLQYNTIPEKLWGKPNHLPVYLFILTSIDSTVLVTNSYMSSGHNSIGINTCNRLQTLNFPCNRSILWGPFCYILDVSFAWLISFKDSSNQRPKLFTDSTDTEGILWPPTLKFIFWFTFHFLRERLQDFFGLNFIIHQIICLSIRLRVLGVEYSLDERIVASSMNAFTGGIWSSAISALFSVAFRSSYIAERKVLVTPNIPLQFQLKAGSN